MSGINDRRQLIARKGTFQNPPTGPTKDQLRDQLREALENTARDALKAAELRDA